MYHINYHTSILIPLDGIVNGDVYKRQDLNIVTVFTNPRVNLLYGPSDSVFTQKQFMEYLKNTELLKTGDLDVADTTRILAKLAKIQEKRASRGRLSKTRKGEKRE